MIPPHHATPGASSPAESWRRTVRQAGFALLGISISACLPPAEPVRDDPLWIEPTHVSALEIDARLPSDLVALPDGQYLVLDGYRDRALLVDPYDEVQVIGEGKGWEGPTRAAAAADGGVWLVEPDHGLRLVGLDGETVRTLGPEALGDGVEPVAMVDLGEVLVVSDRDGTLLFLDAAGGLKTVVDTDVDGAPLGVIVDLVASDDGVLAVDTLRSCVHVFHPDGTPVSRYGRFGMWTGYMHKPKGVARSAGGAEVIADSALGVQVFGTTLPVGMPFPIGRPTQGGAPIAFEHAIAAEVSDPETGAFLVLDQQAETVWRFTVDAAAVALAAEQRGQRALRESLVDHTDRVAGIGSATCLQCHDGLLNDDRIVWDGDLFAHPVGMVPEEEVPPFFPLTADGEMHCVTCHSPHGVSSLAAVQGTEETEHVADLVRHEHGEQFTRLTRGDSALCIACHGEDPHGDASGGDDAHPAGQELVRLYTERLKERGEAISESPGCLTCHAVHGAANAKLARADSDGGLCGTCHEEQSHADTNHPVGRRANEVLPPAEGTEIPVSPSGQPQCASCHDLIHGRGEVLLREPEGGGHLCVSCHEDQQALVRGSDGHARVRGDRDLTCLGCHDVHGARVDLRLTRGGSGRPGDPTGCLSCHAPGRSASKPGVSPSRAGHKVDGKRHDDKVLVCGLCHDAHDPEPKEDVRCPTCHEEQAQLIERKGHGRATCEDCHAAHKAPRMGGAGTLNPRTRRCLGCHATATATGDTPVVPEFSHPALEFPEERGRLARMAGMKLYRRNGTVLPPEVNGDLTCSTCHYTHGRPAGAAELEKLQIDGARIGCEVCHGEEMDKYYRFVHDPDQRVELDVWD